MIKGFAYGIWLVGRLAPQDQQGWKPTVVAADRVLYLSPDDLLPGLPRRGRAL